MITVKAPPADRKGLLCNTVGGLGSILRCLDQVCSGMTIQTVEAKQLLYSDGDMAEKVFVVFSGAVELSAPEPKPSTGTAGSPGSDADTSDAESSDEDPTEVGQQSSQRQSRFGSSLTDTSAAGSMAEGSGVSEQDQSTYIPGDSDSLSLFQTTVSAKSESAGDESTITGSTGSVAMRQELDGLMAPES